MNGFLALLLLIILVVLFVWWLYEALHALGGERPQSVVIVVVVGLLFLFLLIQMADGIACSDQAEIIMEAVPGPAAGERGEVRKWDFYRCSLYRYR